MSDRPTLETDAAFRKGMNGKQVFEFAERLERERDEAREKSERYRLEANAMMLQRDEARDIGEKLSKQGLEMMDENRTLKRERDEAREALAEAWRFADQWLALADGYLKRINEIQNDIRKN